MTYGVNAYQQVDRSGANYADPWQLTAMLFNGGLERVAQARGAMERGDVAVKGERIGKAIGILDGLRASLNHEEGGELASNLDSLYEYMQRRLVAANAHNDLTALDEVATLLREIKEGWDGIPAEARNAPGQQNAQAGGAV
ncbi:Flagellar secretion chaperone FliS [wastewater metagenome]|uniref:Flagellar secretion chaperone FliS n=2 Tax=unclassified sequences TaxID=12908 RepID=A0A5B8R5I3_9ZZZZ|nr:MULTISPECIES: flagellar export chaperone FliS [Arhodomonas]MCS4502801.1 flagellar export chaperone FliS [Arhodomonas aquaeolei]QEA03716.1 flagellar secretion chaperone FliS [uncultured organism]